MRLKILKPFRFAHQGVRIVNYTPGPIETDDDDLIEVALEQGWAVMADATKALGGAPANKAFQAADEVAQPRRRRGRPRTKPRA